MREHRITSTELLQRVGMQTMTQYLAKQQLSWLGHVIRIPSSRTPKQLLMAEFTNCNRYPFLTYGTVNHKHDEAYSNLQHTHSPPEPTHSSLNPGAAVYTIPAHADSHTINRAPWQIPPPPPPLPHRPSTPEKDKHPHDSSHTHIDPHNYH
jgi:hypothetical protein